MLTRFLSLALFTAILASPAAAGLLEWSSEVRDDPFSKTKKLVMHFFDSPKSALLIMCDERSNNLLLRRVNLAPYDPQSPPPLLQVLSIIVDDGERMDATTSSSRVETGNVAFDADFSDEYGRDLLNQIRDARRALYLKIGDAETETFAMTGSTVAANQALDFCFE